MRRWTRVSGLALWLVCRAAWPQTLESEAIDVAPAPSARFPAAWYPPVSDVAYTTAPVRGAAYSGVMVITANFTDPTTGRAVTSVERMRQMRDSAGRQRTETPMGMSGKDRERVLVEVSDPVSHCGFRWTEPVTEGSQPTAGVNCMSPRLRYAHQTGVLDEVSAGVTEKREANMTVRTVSLGERSFPGGYRALGVRTTWRMDGEGSAERFRRSRSGTRRSCGRTSRCGQGRRRLSWLRCGAMSRRQRFLSSWRLSD